MFSQGCILADGFPYGNGGQKPHYEDSRGGRSFRLPRSSSQVNQRLHCDLSQRALPTEFHLNIQQVEKSADLEVTGSPLALGSSCSWLARRTLSWRIDRAAYLSISRGEGSSTLLLAPWGEVPFRLIASQWKQRCISVEPARHNHHLSARRWKWQAGCAPIYLGMERAGPSPFLLPPPLP